MTPQRPYFFGKLKRTHPLFPAVQYVVYGADGVTPKGYTATLPAARKMARDARNAVKVAAPRDASGGPDA